MKKLQIGTRITRRDSHSMDCYLKDIANYGLLSIDEEVALAQRIRTGDKAALDSMVLGNLRFVVSVAKHYENLGLELSDLISAGNIGLITAAKRFDETVGVKFCSYAVWWIRQSITQALAQEGHLIKLPANQQANMSRVTKEAAHLEQELQRTPSPTEITDRIDEREELIAKAVAAAEKPQSLDAPLAIDEETPRIDTMADMDSPAPDEGLMKESLHSDIECALSNLSHSERNIVKMYYGIDQPHAYSMNEIALRMRLTSERVRQLHGRALQRLLHNPNSERLRTYL